MDEHLAKKLVDDLQQSGFYSEMRAIDACMAAKWECHGGVTYFDKDERATRECDLEAVRKWERLEKHGRRLQVKARILGQVKKSQTPWVVFMDRQIRHSRFTDGLDNIIQTNAMHPERIGQVLRRTSLFERNRWTGTGIHEAFKKPTQSSRWYSAFVSVCKAAESALETAAVARHPGAYFELIKPVVVLDGTLIGAELTPEGRIVLMETNDASFAFEYRSDTYQRPRYFVDVITLDSFPRYLALVAERMIAVTDAL